MTPSIFCLTWPDAVVDAGVPPCFAAAHRLRRIRGINGSASVVTLSAAGRTDLYIHVDPSGLLQLRTALLTSGRGSRSAFRRLPSEFQDEHAVFRLLRFSAGLETPLLGNETARSAIRSAIRDAGSRHFMDMQLAVLFELALDAGDLVDRGTDLDRVRRAGLRAALDLVDRRVRGGQGLLVIGNELPTAEWSARLAGGCRATILAPSARRAGRGSSAVRGTGQPAALSSLPGLLPGVEAVILCASEPRTLITASMLAGRDRPLLLVNLGSESAIEREVVFHSDVQLVGAADLCGDSPIFAEALAQAEEIVRQEARRAVELLAALPASSGETDEFNSFAGGPLLGDLRRPGHDAPQPPFPLGGEAAA